MREVDQTMFAAVHGDGAVVIDVREPDEYVAGHVPGADLVPAAVATSLLVIAMQSLAGFAGHAPTTTLQWGLAAAVTTAAVAGALTGARLTGRVRPDVLRRAFGWFVLAMAIFVLSQQLPVNLRTNPLLWTGIVLAITTVALVAVRRRRTLVRPVVAPPTSVGGQYPLAYDGHQSGTKGQ